jgi:tetratricopeptide (TPR) repeat protein
VAAPEPEPAAAAWEALEDLEEVEVAEEVVQEAPVEPVWEALEPPAMEEMPELLVAEEIPLPVSEPEPAPAAGPVATATLGELYLRQGHLSEATRIFREVLEREPENTAARQGLALLAARQQERRPLEIRELLAGYEPGPEGGAAERKARKAFLLTRYLERIRRGGARNVS